MEFATSVLPVPYAPRINNGALFTVREGYAGDENRSNNLQYEYPYLMQSEDGMLHLTYAYRTRIGVKWVTLKEEDVIGSKRGAGTYNPTSGEVDK